MLEIIALIFLTRTIGNTASKKGLKPGTWKLYTVLSWFAGEIIGIIIGLAMFEIDNLVSIMLVGLAGAIGGYFILRSVLEKMPEKFDDDIDRIGVDDLRP